MDEHTKSVVDAYNRGAAEYATRWTQPHDFMDVERNEFARRLPPKARIVDIGCGPGNDTAYFTAKGFDVMGLDVSAEMIAIAQRRHEGLEFRRMSVFELAMMPMFFDGAWMAYCLLHISRDEAEKAIDALATCLKRHRILFIATSLAPDTECIVAPVLGLTATGEGVPVPQVRWSLSDLRGLLQPRFEEEWTNIVAPLPDVPERMIYNGVLRKR